jgi:hypothetical protein
VVQEGGEHSLHPHGADLLKLLVIQFSYLC